LYYIMTVWLHQRARGRAPAILAAVAGLALAARVEAGQPPAGPQGPGPAAEPVQGRKDGFTLFNPTPREWMREMATDRPDQTESPYTVDAGRLQLEMDFLHMTLDRSGGGVTRVAAWSAVPFNLKLGLLKNVDLQLVVNPYAHLRVEGAGAPEARRASGFENVATRVKVNFWGNDGGRTAFGVMAFVAWPLPASELRSGRTDWGLIFPFALSIRDGWNLGAMTRIDVVADPEGGRETLLVNSVTVGHALTRRLGMYVEVIAARSFVDPRWLGQLDVGWTYALRDTVQLDWGTNFGLVGAAPAFQPFAGLSVRF